MKKSRRLGNSIMHAVHRFLAIQHIVMMDVFANAETLFGPTRWIVKGFNKHDEKAGKHIDQLRKYE